MDRNQIFGIVLIAVILIGYSIYTKPTQEDIEKARQDKVTRDSISRVQEELDKQNAAKFANEENQTLNQESFNQSDSTIQDSAKMNQIKETFGSFGESAIGEQEFYTLENELIKLIISTKGGRPYSVEMKNHQRYDSTTLLLFDGNSTVFGMKFFAENRSISTNEMFFKPVSSNSELNATESEKSAAFRLYAGEDRYIEYTYKMKPGSYLVDFDIRFVGMDKIISSNNSYIDLNWFVNLPSLEKGWKWENQNAGIYWKYFQDEVDWLSETSDEDEESLSTKVKWISFKQQFFSSVLIAKTSMLNASVEHENFEENSKYLKKLNANISLPFDGTANEKIEFAFYYGPNKYDILKNINIDENEDLNLTKMIPLGWGIFGWINRFAIIPLFNFLGGFLSSYGLIILVMTVLIKLILFPLTYKSYASSAKMRVLKPQIDEINKKIPKDKSMERQQATMALYKKAGVNPMGGCLPMVLQFPILIAMFRFFPASIELRQQSFLWATDLSSYDSIYDLPFTIPFYGDHVSLFTLLMAVSIIFSTKLNSSQMQGANAQMPGMKTMMYMMPVMMLFWFNNYSAGLSYYYFLSNLITVGQTLIIRRFVDDEAVLKKLNENKKKPKKKSKFQSRLEDMAKQRGYNQKKK
ncbi:MAG: membrane protein insertase YidC [Bacteroidetes bacterium]|nr:MAG: membrane protein insertase YidC [Bacteroidota bacterium]